MDQHGAHDRDVDADVEEQRRPDPEARPPGRGSSHHIAVRYGRPSSSGATIPLASMTSSPAPTSERGSTRRRRRAGHAAGDGEEHERRGHEPAGEAATGLVVSPHQQEDREEQEERHQVGGRGPQDEVFTRPPPPWTGGEPAA